MAATISSPPHATQLKQVDTPRTPFSARTDGGRLEATTQVHAAAINGDKQTLARLISIQNIDLDVGDQFGRSPLMFCVLADRLECAEMLIKAGAQVNLKDRGGRMALHWAAHKGNLRFMKLLLSRGADCREKDNEGQTAFHFCTRHKLPKCMALLLRQLTPGEIDDQDKNKRTALHWAASYGNLEHVKMLIKQDSNIGIPDTEGKTPLHWAASSQDREAVSCVRLILETTPSVINWQDYEGRTALHLAVADGNESVVNVLTSMKNCNVSALDNVFRTPLHWAAVLGHSRIVALLLASEADYTSSDSNGATALHYAAQNNFSDTVIVFLIQSCTDETDLEGRTAFMWAAGKGADDVIKVFLDYNVDIQQEDKTGATALHAAALSGHSSTVKLLLDHGAKMEATDQVKHTPLFRACEMGHLDVVQTLIECGVRVDVLDQEGRSALHWAALGGHAYICQILIKYGVYPNVRDHSARAPLHCAAYGGYVNCMSALMEHGAEPNSQDKEGMACLHWACSKGHLDAVKLLIEYRAFPNHMEFTEDRYTPLDYALMGEHHDVAQYMIEQGALSITGIQDIAALNIQSAFRGYRVRKAFTERKKLLMKHEKLKKEAARKRAAEEGKKTEVAPPLQPLQQKDLQQNYKSTQPQQQSAKTCGSLIPGSPSQGDVREKKQDNSSSIACKDSSPLHQLDLEPNTKQPQQQHAQPQPSQSSQPKRPPVQRRPRSKALQRRRRPGQGEKQQTTAQKTRTDDETFHAEQIQLEEAHSQWDHPGESKSDTSPHFTQAEPERERDEASPHRREIIKENENQSKHQDSRYDSGKPASTTYSKSKGKRPPEPTESERVLAGKSETQKAKLKERQRRQTFQVKVEAATKIQRAWRRYRNRKSKNKVAHQIMQMSKDAIHKKRVRTTQEEWEKQIAALTIQLAWRKYYRKKLLRALHPNRRQLQMWDPEIIALKQQALLHHIYNEQIQAPFWHPTLKAPTRPLWLRFVPSPAAVSYNFALDQYVPWISGQGGPGQGPLAWQQVEEQIGILQAQCDEQQTQSPHQNSSHASTRSDLRSSESRRRENSSNKDGQQRPRTTIHSGKRGDSYSSKNSRTRKS